MTIATVPFELQAVAISTYITSLLRFAQRLRVFRPNQQIYISFKCLNMSINDLIVPSTNIVACFLSAYYNIQGPHPPETNYSKAALASTKFKIET